MIPPQFTHLTVPITTSSLEGTAESTHTGHRSDWRIEEGASRATERFAAAAAIAVIIYVNAAAGLDRSRRLGGEWQGGSPLGVVRLTVDSVDSGSTFRSDVVVFAREAVIVAAVAGLVTLVGWLLERNEVMSHGRFLLVFVGAVVFVGWLFLAIPVVWFGSWTGGWKVAAAAVMVFLPFLGAWVVGIADALTRPTMLAWEKTGWIIAMLAMGVAFGFFPWVNLSPWIEIPVSLAALAGLFYFPWINMRDGIDTEAPTPALFRTTPDDAVI